MFTPQKEYTPFEVFCQKVLIVPFTYTQRLKNATLEELKDYRLIAGGIGVHFESINEDISVDGIIRDFGDENKRINISASESFLDKADFYAKQHHLSRSALLQKATLKYICR